MKPPITPQHVVLDVQQPHPKIKRIFRFIREKSFHQNVKERSRTLYQLSLDFPDPSPLDYPIGKISTNLKRLKFLKSLKIDLNCLPSDHTNINILINSLKHLKNISMLNLIHARIDSPDKTDKKGISLYKALNRTQKSLPKLQINLSISSLALQSHFLKFFSKIKRPTSVEFACKFECNLSHFQERILELKNSQSLFQISLKFSYHKFDDLSGLQNLIESLVEFKSLKTSRFYFDQCTTTTSKGGSVYKKLVPSLKKVAQTQSVELIFDQSFEDIIGFERKSFKKSIKNIHPSHTVQAKFIEGKGLYLRKIFVVLVIFVTLVIAVASITSYACDCFG